jgi:hypothetical protein
MERKKRAFQNKGLFWANGKKCCKKETDEVKTEGLLGFYLRSGLRGEIGDGFYTGLLPM